MHASTFIISHVVSHWDDFEDRMKTDSGFYCAVKWQPPSCNSLIVSGNSYRLIPDGTWRIGIPEDRTLTRHQGITMRIWANTGAQSKTSPQDACLMMIPNVFGTYQLNRIHVSRIIHLTKYTALLFLTIFNRPG